jgi:hypothetical protein
VASAYSVPYGRRHVRPQTCRASETGHRLSAWPGCLRGEARASQVTRPSSSCVPWSNTPPDTIPSSPEKNLSPGMVVAFRQNRTLGIREGLGFGAAFPWPTRSHAYASPMPFLTPSQGLLPARAGSPLAGRISHPLDSSSALASLRSKVSKPSVNQPYTGANRSYASLRLPCRCHRRLRLVASLSPLLQTGGPDAFGPGKTVRLYPPPS